MKKQMIFLMGIFLTMGLYFSGCAAKDAVSPNCTDTANYCNGLTLTTCCTTTSCYYKINGKQYNCSGTDCVSAAQTLVNEQCSQANIDDIVGIAARLTEQADGF